MLDVWHASPVTSARDVQRVRGYAMAVGHVCPARAAISIAAKGVSRAKDVMVARRVKGALQIASRSARPVKVVEIVKCVRAASHV